MPQVLCPVLVGRDEEARWLPRPWDADATALYARLFDQAVVGGSPATDLLAETAGRLGIWLSVGVDERDDRDSTIYNTLLHFAPDGTLAARHNKLMPTGGERLVWGWATGRPCRSSTPGSAGSAG